MTKDMIAYVLDYLNILNFIFVFFETFKFVMFF